MHGFLAFLASLVASLVPPWWRRTPAKARMHVRTTLTPGHHVVPAVLWTKSYRHIACRCERAYTVDRDAMVHICPACHHTCSEATGCK